MKPTVIRDKQHYVCSENTLQIPRVKTLIKIKSGRLLVRTVLDERAVQKHRIETLNKNKDALKKE